MRYWVFLSILVCVSCSSDTRAVGSLEGDFQEPPYCPDCEIELVEVGVLGDAADDTSMREDAGSAPCVVGRMASGEFLMGAPVGGGEILVYGASGPSTRTIGRPGQGPGEFGTELRLVVGPGDTVYVLDEENARIQVMSPSGDYVRSFALPARVSTFALLTTGEVLIHPAPRPQSPDPLPLFYLFSPSGEEIRRFGVPGENLSPLDQWAVSPTPEGGFWEANIRRYEANLRRTDGTVSRTINRSVDWFPPDAEVDPGFPATGPLPTILYHFWHNEEGLLWVFLLRPDEDWQPPSSAEITPQSTRQMFDMMIEVLDLENSRLVTSLRIDEWLGAVCGSNLMYTVFYTEEGDTRVRVFEPRLVGYGG